MRTIITHILVVFGFGICSIVHIHAQEHPFLASFEASRHERFVHLEWVMKAGNTCNGIQIYRSIDGLTFEQIGAIHGICGSLTQSERYEFDDKNPVPNRINYYQLKFGGIEASKILSVEFIEYGSLGYQIRPHPADNKARIYFDNPGNKVHQLEIFGPHGTRVEVILTNDELFHIPTAGLHAGLYVFVITELTSANRTTGVLVVHH